MADFGYWISGVGCREELIPPTPDTRYPISECRSARSRAGRFRPKAPSPPTWRRRRRVREPLEEYRFTKTASIEEEVVEGRSRFREGAEELPAADVLHVAVVEEDHVQLHVVRDPRRILVRVRKVRRIHRRVHPEAVAESADVS